MIYIDMVSETIHFFILPGFDTLSAPFSDRFSKWESIGIRTSLLSRKKLVDLLSNYECSNHVRKESILWSVQPTPKSADVIVEDSSDIVPYSDTVIYAMNESGDKLLFFFIVRFESTMVLRVILFYCPYPYDVPSIHKLIEYMHIMGATSICLESFVETIDVYKTLGFVRDDIHYNDIQLRIVKKRGFIPMLYAIPVI